MKIFSQLFFFTICTTIGLSQSMVNHPQNLNEALLIKNYRRKCDSLRLSQSLRGLQYDACLKDAAQHHVNYLAKENKQGHTENNSATPTVKSRVLKFCKETRMAWGENQLMNFAESPDLWGIIQNSAYEAAYEDLAHELFMQFYTSESHYRNMIFKGFTRSATAIYFKHTTKSIWLVDVFTSD